MKIQDVPSVSGQSPSSTYICQNYFLKSLGLILENEQDATNSSVYQVSVAYSWKIDWKIVDVGWQLVFPPQIATTTLKPDLDLLGLYPGNTQLTQESTWWRWGTEALWQDLPQSCLESTKGIDTSAAEDHKLHIGDFFLEESEYSSGEKVRKERQPLH